MTHNTKIKILTATAIVFISQTVFVTGATKYEPLSGTGAEKILPGLNSGGLATMFKGFYKWGVGIAILLAVFMVVVGGIRYMTTDAIFDKGEGKKIIQNAFLGLLIVLSSYTILYAINPKILEINLDFNDLKSTAVKTNSTSYNQEKSYSDRNKKLLVDTQTDLNKQLPISSAKSDNIYISNGSEALYAGMNESFRSMVSVQSSDKDGITGGESVNILSARADKNGESYLEVGTSDSKYNSYLMKKIANDDPNYNPSSEGSVSINTPYTIKDPSDPSKEFTVINKPKITNDGKNTETSWFIYPKSDNIESKTYKAAF